MKINISEDEYFPFYFISIEGISRNNEILGGFMNDRKVEITDKEYEELKNYLKNFGKWQKFLKEKFEQKKHV
jgi:uncharacterized Fe-S cluster-containing protein